MIILILILHPLDVTSSDWHFELGENREHQSEQLGPCHRQVEHRAGDASTCKESTGKNLVCEENFHRTFLRHQGTIDESEAVKGLHDHARRGTPIGVIHLLVHDDHDAATLDC